MLKKALRTFAERRKARKKNKRKRIVKNNVKYLSKAVKALKAQEG